MPALSEISDKRKRRESMPWQNGGDSGIISSLSGTLSKIHFFNVSIFSTQLTKV